MTNVLYPNMTQGVGALFTWANTVTQGMWWSFILLVCMLFTFVYGLKWGTKRAMTMSTFFGMVVGVLFRSMGLVADWLIVSVAFIFTGALLWAYFDK